MYCTACGGKNADLATFCISCGNRILRPERPETPAPAPAATAIEAEPPNSGVSGDPVAWTAAPPTPLVSAATPSDVAPPEFATAGTPVAELFEHLSLWRFAFLSLATLGIYSIVWSYRQWVVARRTSRPDVSPLWRAVFNGLFFYSLFAEIRSRSHSLGVRTDVSPGLMAILYVAFGISWRLPSPYFLIGLVAIAPPLLAQAEVNRQWSAARRVPGPDRKLRWWQWPVLSLGCLALLAVLAEAVMPNGIEQLSAWKRNRDVDAFIRADPVWRIVVADNPKARLALKTAVGKALEGTDEHQARAELSGLLAPLFPPYLARASGDATVEFATRLLDSLRGLASTDPEDCYRYLFPKVAGPPDLTRLPGKEQSYDAMRLVVESAQNKQPPIDKEAAQSALRKVVERMATNGEDASALAQAETPGVDRKRVCSLSISLYTHILELPRYEAGNLLRFLFSQTNLE